MLVGIYRKIMEFFGFSCDPIAGLEISGNEVKILQLSKQRGRIQVDGYAIEPIEADNPEGITTAIKNSILKSRIRTRKVCVAIASSKVMNKIIKISTKLSNKDIACEIELEIDKYFPYPVEEIAFDYAITNIADSNQAQKVLLSATKLQHVNDITTLVHAAGLEPVILDVDAYATARAFAELMAVSYEDYILFEITCTVILIIVIKSAYVLYVREQTYESSSSLQSQLLQLYKEFNAADPAFVSKSIYLISPNEHINDLDKLIELELQIPSFIVNPCANIMLDPNLLRCCGLALRNIN